MIERLAQLVLAAEAVSEGFGDPLDRPHQGVRTADVLGEQDPAAGPQHALGLADRGSIIGNSAEAVGADHGVETVVREGEVRRVADHHLKLAAEIFGSLTAERGHLRAELDPSDTGASGVEGQVAGCAGRDVEDPALGPLGDPIAVASEQQTLETGHALVVLRRLLVEDLPDSLGFAGPDRAVLAEAAGDPIDELADRPRAISRAFWIEDQLAMSDRELQGAPQPKLANQLQGVARGPVLDDPAVLEAADHDPAQLDLSTLVSAAQLPA